MYQQCLSVSRFFFTQKQKKTCLRCEIVWTDMQTFYCQMTSVIDGYKRARVDGIPDKYVDK